jgi:hypothetical protein
MALLRKAGGILPSKPARADSNKAALPRNEPRVALQRPSAKSQQAFSLINFYEHFATQVCYCRIRLPPYILSGNFPSSGDN